MPPPRQTPLFPSASRVSNQRRAREFRKPSEARLRRGGPFGPSRSGRVALRHSDVPVMRQCATETIGNSRRQPEPRAHQQAKSRSGPAASQSLLPVVTPEAPRLPGGAFSVVLDLPSCLVTINRCVARPWGTGLAALGHQAPACRPYRARPLPFSPGAQAVGESNPQSQVD